MGAIPYYYDIIGDDLRNFCFIEKLFKHQKECVADTFWALANQPPPRYKYRLPVLVGQIQNKMRYIDVSKCNFLIAGRTRSGKSAGLGTMILSMLLYCHPQYLKLICLDVKRTSFKDLKDKDSIHGIATVGTDAAQIMDILNALWQEMERRYITLEAPGAPSKSYELNARAYRARKKEMIMPHIVVVFDEFGDFFDGLKGEEKQKAIHLVGSIARKGIACGIHLIFATQSPYKEYLKGSIAANMQYRLSYALSRASVVPLILDKKKTDNDPSPLDLQNGGWFVFKEKSDRELGRSFETTWKCLRNASINLKKAGFDYSFRF